MLERHILIAIPLAVLAFYYSVQNLIAIERVEGEVIVRLLVILLVGAAALVIAYLKVPAREMAGWVPVKLSKRSVSGLFLASVTAYAAIIALSIVTADRVALFEAFRGADANQLAEYRETFLRTRTGAGQALHYLYVICNNSFMPIALAWAFGERKRWRYAILAVFVFGLSLTLQKGAIAAATLPLFVLFMLSRRYWSAIGAVVFTLAVVASMYVIASGRLAIVLETPEVISGQTSGGAHEHLVAPENASSVPSGYNIMPNDGQISLMANRIVWIPYVTAADWVRYRLEVLHGDLVLGRSVGIVAKLTGREPINLEREVAEFQWGQNEQGTASSNAHFFVDAWVNFGIIGVALYAVIFGAIIAVITETRYLPLIAGAVVPVYTAGFVGLPPVLLSGGLFVFACFAIILRPQDIG